MDRAELLAVTDTFQISGQGLVVMPDFAAAQGTWKGGTTPATVVRPDGSTLEAKLNLHIAHFNIPDPTVPLERRWRIVPTFPDLRKDDVPAGSRVLVAQEVVEAISGPETAIR